MRFHKRLMGDSLSQRHARMCFLFIGGFCCVDLQGDERLWREVIQVRSLLPFLEQEEVRRLKLGETLFSAKDIMELKVCLCHPRTVIWC